MAGAAANETAMVSAHIGQARREFFVMFFVRTEEGLYKSKGNGKGPAVAFLRNLPARTPAVDGHREGLARSQAPSLSLALRLLRDDLVGDLGVGGARDHLLGLQIGLGAIRPAGNDLCRQRVTDAGQC